MAAGQTAIAAVRVVQSPFPPPARVAMFRSPVVRQLPLMPYSTMAEMDTAVVPAVPVAASPFTPTVAISLVGISAMAAVLVTALVARVRT